MSTIDSYTSELKDWKTLLVEKNLIFDNDAIVSLLEYKATGLIDELKRHRVSCCYIHPVLMELLNTNSVVDRATRQTIVDKFTFVKITDRVFENAKDLQIELHDECDCYPSPTDVYLGACAKMMYDTYLLTSNLKDFPYPSFERESGILLQNSKHTKLLSILKHRRSKFTPIVKPSDQMGMNDEDNEIPF